VATGGVHGETFPAAGGEDTYDRQLPCRGCQRVDGVGGGVVTTGLLTLCADDQRPVGDEVGQVQNRVERRLAVDEPCDGQIGARGGRVEELDAGVRRRGDKRDLGAVR
jgi:hypothetical protein